jgi:hypothetical protein
MAAASLFTPFQSSFIIGSCGIKVQRREHARGVYRAALHANVCDPLSPWQRGTDLMKITKVMCDANGRNRKAKDESV